MGTCIECRMEFTPSYKQRGRQKFCSEYCRNKNWTRNNPERVAYHRKKYNISKSNKVCIICDKKIPYGTKNWSLCSEKCRKIKHNLDLKKHRKKAQQIFHKWKLEQGCKICGYNKCPASLDLHHLYGKDFRITAKTFVAMSERTKKEMEKCIIVCKNCHYELHFNKIKKYGGIIEYKKIYRKN